MKKSLLIMLLVLACVLALTACGEETHTHVKDSNGLGFRLNADRKSYSITDIGFCNDTDIVIPSVRNGLPVTIIGDRAFYDCDSLTSVVIPDSVTIIGDSAFRDCDSLTSVVIPDSVTSIAYYAFHGCDSLTIYCEATSQPSGWDSDWNSGNRPVVWGYTEN